MIYDAMRTWNQSLIPNQPKTTHHGFAAAIRSVWVATALAACSLGAAHGAAATPWPGGTWTPPTATYGSALGARQSIIMSDGVTLAADVSYPTNPDGTRAAGPFPVIMTQTPYVFSTPTAGDYFVKRGYIYVTAWVRGSTKSGGPFGLFSHRDALDGAELARWAAAIPGSNGIVGLHGGSYAGLNQMYTVATLGAGSPVKAMAAMCMGAEQYREVYNTGGIFTQTLNFHSNLTGLIGPQSQFFGNALMASVKSGGDAAYYRDAWKERGIIEIVPEVLASGVPALLWSSSGDIYAQGALALYTYLQNGYAGQALYGPMNRAIAPTPRYQINFNQGGHCANQDQAVQLEWFETWLKGVNTGMANTAMPIHVNEQGSNRWFNTSHYPVVPQYTKFYLDNLGMLSSAAPAAAGVENLRWAQPSAVSTVQYDSPVLAAGGTLAGHMSASIYASSTTSNLELIATVQSVASDGAVTTLSTGAVLGSLATNDPVRSWSDSQGTPVFPYGKYDVERVVPAGTVNKYDFVIYPRFAHLPAGSKLRVVFTTQTPTSKCSAGLGIDPCFPTLPQRLALNGSVVTIFHGPSTPSSINLPLLSASCWRYTDDATSPTPSVPVWGPTDPVVVNAASPCQLQ